MKTLIKYFEKGEIRIEDETFGLHHPDFWCCVYRFSHNSLKYSVYANCFASSRYRSLIKHFVETQQFQKLKRFQTFISYSKPYNGREGLV